MKKADTALTVRFPIESQNKDVFWNFEKLKFYLPKKKKRKDTPPKRKESNKTHDMEETVATELYQNNVWIRK